MKARRRAALKESCDAVLFISDYGFDNHPLSWEEWPVCLIRVVHRDHGLGHGLVSWFRIALSKDVSWPEDPGDNEAHGQPRQKDQRQQKREAEPLAPVEIPDALEELSHAVVPPTSEGAVCSRSALSSAGS